jgi:hypothetical protein
VAVCGGGKKKKSGGKFLHVKGQSQELAAYKRYTQTRSFTVYIKKYIFLKYSYSVL